MDNQEILLEIRDRLVRMETKMEGFPKVQKKAEEAHELSRTNEKAIEKIDKKFSKILGAAWSIFAALMIALFNYFLNFFKGEGS